VDTAAVVACAVIVMTIDAPRTSAPRGSAVATANASAAV